MAWKPDYCTVAELKSYLSMPEDDVQDDVKLALVITASSRAIDSAMNRQFGQFAAAMERFYEVRRGNTPNSRVIEIDDLMSTAGLIVDGVSSDNYKLYPRNALQDGKPWTEIRVSGVSLSYDSEISVTAKFGWNAIPEPIKSACLLQSARLFMRKDAPFGVTGSPDGSSETRLLARLDPDVQVLLSGYYRWWAAV